MRSHGSASWHQVQRDPDRGGGGQRRQHQREHQSGAQQQQRPDRVQSLRRARPRCRRRTPAPARTAAAPAGATSIPERRIPTVSAATTAPSRLSNGVPSASDASSTGNWSRGRCSSSARNGVATSSGSAVVAQCMNVRTATSQRQRHRRQHPLLQRAVLGVAAEQRVQRQQPGQQHRQPQHRGGDLGQRLRARRPAPARTAPPPAARTAPAAARRRAGARAGAGRGPSAPWPSRAGRGGRRRSRGWPRCSKSPSHAAFPSTSIRVRTGGAA